MLKIDLFQIFRKPISSNTQLPGRNILNLLPEAALLVKANKIEFVFNSQPCMGAH